MNKLTNASYKTTQNINRVNNNYYEEQINKRDNRRFIPKYCNTNLLFPFPMSFET